ncbi:MAG TPA: efflux RND transporter periplasmic adaptor subunit [archaeon]|nr:efflux RND transporter periplasmic adaptor subunit [archaeon]
MIQLRDFILIAVAAPLLLACGGRDDRKQAGGTVQGQVRRTFTETGELRAVRNTAVPMPWYHFEYGQPQISFLEKEGTVVKKGDLVAQLETSGVLKSLQSKKEELAIAQADLNKMKVDNQSRLEQLNGELQSTLSAFQQTQIDTQRVKYESETRKVISRLELEQALIALRKVQNKIESTRQVQEHDVNIQQIRIAQTRYDIETAEKAIDNFSLHAPAEGMIVYSDNRSTRQKIRVGDQLHPGTPIITLPDLTRMKVLTTVNETDVQKIAVGRKVSVRLDAFPKIAFPGTITTIGYICRRKDRNSNIKVFDVEVLINRSDRILKPGMTVSCEFLPGG